MNNAVGVGPYGAQPAQDVGRQVFPTSPHEADGVGQLRLWQLAGQFDQYAADCLAIRVELPGAHPLPNGSVLLATLLVPDSLANEGQRIFRIVGGAALERFERRVVALLELSPGQDAQGQQTGRPPNEHAGRRSGGRVESMVERRATRLSDQSGGVGHELLVLQL